MKPIRKVMAPERADRLYMAVATDDLIEAVNIPLRARKGTFGVDYTGHTPELWVQVDGEKPEMVAFVDTRRRCTVFTRIQQEPVRLMVEDIHRRLQKNRAQLSFVVQKDRLGRKIAKLQISAADSRHIVIWLAKVPHKTRQGSIGPFELKDSEAA